MDGAQRARAARLHPGDDGRRRRPARRQQRRGLGRPRPARRRVPATWGRAGADRVSAGCPRPRWTCAPARARSRSCARTLPSGRRWRPPSSARFWRLVRPTPGTPRRLAAGGLAAAARARARGPAAPLVVVVLPLALWGLGLSLRGPRRWFQSLSLWVILYFTWLGGGVLRLAADARAGRAAGRPLRRRRARRPVRRLRARRAGLRLVAPAAEGAAGASDRGGPAAHFGMTLATLKRKE